MRSLKIGIVCPYGWDTPGGVQIHIKELTQWLIAKGHEVSVLAPVTDEGGHIEPWVVSAGRPISIPYNGAIAKVIFGPLASSRVKQWIANGDFDLLHLHEPAIPSLSLLAGWAGDGPMVATFHAAANPQKVANAIGTMLDPLIERITAKIAVSEIARETLKDRFSTEAVVIPNGIDTSKFEGIGTRSEWALANTLGFIGRFDEPRKGLAVLLAAIPKVVNKIPNLRILVAGPGNASDFEKLIPSELRERITFLGRISEIEKAQFFKSISLYIAPNTGSESFGIILAEAMAAKTPIVASDLPAFVKLLDDGASGAIFTSEDSENLAETILNLLENQEKRERIAIAGYEKAKSCDWNSVGDQILSVYEMALAGNTKVSLASENRFWNRLRSND
ncbi:MAG: glycosyltransferase family 4 protein [Actinobacteria bacterium]|nr:glycosyltransferase family 4 protein [Actinomycetota bacterium]MDA2981768.1 glycosyltransferase family 4 protein [Actinomycetota bacterium]MDA2996776.1 glycosyltransferase family 4 protein [Actinomycetota bacterium]